MALSSKVLRSLEKRCWFFVSECKTDDEKNIRWEEELYFSAFASEINVFLGGNEQNNAKVLQINAKFIGECNNFA